MWDSKNTALEDNLEFIHINASANMKRIRCFLLLSWILSFSLAAQEGNISPIPSPRELGERLGLLKGIERIEALESEHFKEKYLVYVTQQVDPKNPAAGTFGQRVVVAHAGFDRPTVIVTEGYGGAYAQSSRYQDEVAKLLNANLVHVEHRYFLESVPDPLDWDYLTTENAAYDLHHVTETFKQVYSGKWISTGISKGGQTAILYRAWFPDDVDVSVPYVAPLNRSVEDGRHEPFLRKAGNRAERARILDFQKEVLKHRFAMLPLLETFCKEKELTFRMSPDEVLDYCVLEYPFAFWQWGTAVHTVPAPDADDETLFSHLVRIAGPDYFASNQDMGAFFVQAAREMGYYGYDTKPLRKLLSIESSAGYLKRFMLPESAGDIPFSAALMYDKVYNYLKENDPKMILIYGETDPWSAVRVPDFKGKKNMQIYIAPRGSHSTRIRTMPEKTREKIIRQLNEWTGD
ncbi:Prolyl tri/tetrapeptidyl aminopeptidase precursor [Bacteroidales bacterium Barb4]|nr:Prolyl tri/tetrapeptidyl aminopeptidase precursor [Bacteroidales bacterium Barb4]